MFGTIRILETVIDVITSGENKSDTTLGEGVSWIAKIPQRTVEFGLRRAPAVVVFTFASLI